MRDRAELQAMFAKTDLAAHTTILRRHLTKESHNPSLIVKPGYRAVSIPVDAVTSIENFAEAGSRVDLVLTHRKNGQLLSEVIAQNARVLSLGGETRNSAVRGVPRAVGSMTSRTITLEVLPSDALEVRTAIKMGTLSLLLRNPYDDRPLDKKEFRESELGRPSKGPRKRIKKCGVVKMAGEDYIAGCDGNLTKIMNSLDP